MYMFSRIYNILYSFLGASRAVTTEVRHNTNGTALNVLKKMAEFLMVKRILKHRSVWGDAIVGNVVIPGRCQGS